MSAWRKPDNREFCAERSKWLFWQNTDDQVIFDEVQASARYIFPTYKRSVTARPDRMGGFILSGRKTFHLMERITQKFSPVEWLFSKLLPPPPPFFLFSGEKKKPTKGGTEKALRLRIYWQNDSFWAQLIHGFFTLPYVWSEDFSQWWFLLNYVQTYVNRDCDRIDGSSEIWRPISNFFRALRSTAGQLLI